MYEFDQIVSKIEEKSNEILSTEEKKVNRQDITDDFEALNEGYGIKILTGIKASDVFLFFYQNYLLVKEHDSIAKSKKLEEAELVEIMSLYYACKTLFFTDPSNSNIRKITKQINYITDGLNI
jgi:hypothetical protein